MTTYSYAELEALWIMAGGPAAQAALAAAIAEAESDGNPLAAYPSTTVAAGQGSTTTATGLWQILGLPSGDFTASELTIPLDNAKMAVAKYEQAGNSFSPWQTYADGTYSVQSGVTPATSVPGASSQGGSGAAVSQTATLDSSISSSLNPLSGLTGLVAPVTDIAKDFDDTLKVFHFLTGGPSAWLRVGAFFMGVLLLAGAVWCFARASDDAPLIPRNLPSLPIPVPV